MPSRLWPGCIGSTRRARSVGEACRAWAGACWSRSTLLPSRVGHRRQLAAALHLRAAHIRPVHAGAGQLPRGEGARELRPFASAEAPRALGVAALDQNFYAEAERAARRAVQSVGTTSNPTAGMMTMPASAAASPCLAALSRTPISPVMSR